jgi:hypothetical protein
MRIQRLGQCLEASSPAHLRQGPNDLLFGSVDILQSFEKQVFKGLGSGAGHGSSPE